MAAELLFPAAGKELFDVFAEQVGFQIYPVTHSTLAQSRDGKRVGDDPDMETF